MEKGKLINPTPTIRSRTINYILVATNMEWLTYSMSNAHTLSLIGYKLISAVTFHSAGIQAIEDVAEGYTFTTITACKDKLTQLINGQQQSHLN
ncbi:MAG: hypothetical protein ABIX01_11890 [Chitinophagaceae bacterium]